MLNTIDLFAGCGGLTDGFKQSGEFKLLAGVEWDKHAIHTLRQRLSTRWNYSEANSSMLHFDIQRTDELIFGYDNDPEYGSSTGLNKLVGSNKVDAVIGGPPCQAYSIAGRIRDENGMHDDYRNFLFESYMKVVSYFKPQVCIFENVQGMLSAAPGGVSIVERVTKAFNDAGYYISTNLKRDALFDTSEFGVPQKRLRVIIVALRKDAFSDCENKVKQFYKKLNSYKVDIKATVDDAIGDLPQIFPIENAVARTSHQVEDSKQNALNHEPRFHNARDIEIFNLLAEDIRSGRNEYVHSDALKKLYTEKTGKSSSVHKYHVLRPNLPSNTIPAHLYKDGLRHIHPDPEQSRSITVREAARLQTFADDFEFCAAQGANYKMIGNAVPPLFAKYVALAVNELFISEDI
ncbi:DNA cytosine methyltransferase [Vibrio cyclitrophicus]|uniref:DNA cytosine methyltransferase n=1 Tax=Vibrio cyclitrophicus TaxID=47951 RepID=UPI000C867B4C|nr:DNA cytosine methyltransferase [Vibrio cyclitrophicus]PMJ55835.1 DNA (cytosine-5-)-methyltransferase [Vibrio cyclitrophicus]